MSDLENRILLITGAAGGIGRATVNVFLQKGWRVIGVDRQERYSSFPEDGFYIQADISLPEQIELIYAQVSAYTDRLDVVVNNAAFQIEKPLLETTAEEWDMVMASNLRSVFLGAKLAHPLLAKQAQVGGSAIVNVSSVHAVATSADIAAYAASKGGLLALTRAMAIEFARDEIRVNAILPGAVDTPMLRAGLSRGHVGDGTLIDRLENLARKTVNGRVGQPEEIARAIYFLADNTQSSFMTGQALIVDGGATARLSTE
ncbi:MAG: SDR family oxidoreductase [Chloroflexi bacterium]|nr:SDR family oxidoreductase [Chloroflexota bacterium]